MGILRYHSICFDGPLCIKIETCKGFDGEDIDFVYQDLLEVDSNSTEEFIETMTKAKEGEKFRLDLDCEGRDVFFDEDQLYAVFDREDVEALIARLQNCLDR